MAISQQPAKFLDLLQRPTGQWPTPDISRRLRFLVELHAICPLHPPVGYRKPDPVETVMVSMAVYVHLELNLEGEPDLGFRRGETTLQPGMAMGTIKRLLPIVEAVLFKGSGVGGVFHKVFHGGRLSGG